MLQWILLLRQNGVIWIPRKNRKLPQNTNMFFLTNDWLYKLPMGLLAHSWFEIMEFSLFLIISTFWHWKMAALQKLAFSSGQTSSNPHFCREWFWISDIQFSQPEYPECESNCFVVVRFLRGWILKVQSWKLEKMQKSFGVTCSKCVKKIHIKYSISVIIHPWN